MSKIPVGKTLADAYSFTFGGFLTVLGLCWFSLLIVGIGAYFAFPPYFRAIQAMAVNRDPSALSSGFGYMGLFGILAFLCFNMIYVAIARQALGLRSGPAVFYFSLDAAFWRLLGSYLLMILLLIGLVLVVSIGMGLLAGALTVALGAPGVALGVGAGIVVALASIYVMLRLMFLIVPVAVAEHGMTLRRSWSLSKGNFWRIFAVLLGIFVPLFVAEVVMLSVVGSFITIAPLTPDPDPAELAAQLQQISEQFMALAPILAPVAFVLYAAVISLIVSASAFAYRALVPAPEGAAAEFA